MQVSLSSYRLLPEDSGVYLFLGENNKVLYVGKAKNLRKRVTSYFTHKDLGEKTLNLLSQAKNIKIIKVASEIESFLVEANLIKKYLPKYNIKLTDGKSYPLIKITNKDKYPKILITRRAEDKNSIYFGPYPKANAMRMVLRTIRRIFPFESVLNHPKKPCLYNHMGLCPCAEFFGDGEYKKDIRRIIRFLNGETGKVIADLSKERNLMSKYEEYEKARDLQKKIDAIKIVTSPVYHPFEYELNPNLKEDIRLNELNGLIAVLNTNGVAVQNLDRIECFDISNISGSSIAASMVVFKNGEKDSGSYRKFRIKYQNNGKPNDVMAMAEVIARRLNHTEWDYPGLIIVDGGKGQVSAAINTLKKRMVNIPVIGLAKKEETIITEKNIAINLPYSSQALHLVMRIRDEAHRFALSYHKKLRSKNFLNGK